MNFIHNMFFMFHILCLEKRIIRMKNHKTDIKSILGTYFLNFTYNYIKVQQNGL